jgi:hypothetical protein
MLVMDCKESDRELMFGAEASILKFNRSILYIPKFTGCGKFQQASFTQ